MISRIRDLGNADDLVLTWNQILDTYKDYTDVTPGRVESFIYEFGPGYNIYVSNEKWNATTSIQYQRIIFARYQMHVPTIKKCKLA